MQPHLEPTPPTESHLRSARDRRSRRSSYGQTDSRRRDRAFLRNYEDAPLPPPPGNLHESDGDAFNVDPNVPYLASGGISIAGQSPDRGRSSGGRKFVGEFVVGLRNLVRNNGNRRHRNGDHEVGGIHHPTPTYPAVYERPGWPGASNLEDVDVSEDAGSLQLHGSSPTTSETAYETYDSHDTHDFYDEEMTAVNHEIIPAPITSPVSVEPLPGEAYLKMDSPTPSVISFGTYVNRIQEFFRDLNSLPWVADRVTVDYIPKRRARPRPTHQPILSWNSHASQHVSIDLLSGSSSPSTYQRPPTELHTSGAYPNANGINTSVPMSSHVLGTAEQYPIYPHGYVPYQPVGQPLVSGGGAGGQNVVYVQMNQTHALPVQASMHMQGV